MDYFRINAPLIVEITGKDSVRYLNSRLTNDVKNLSINSSLVAAALTPQGKTQGLFTVKRIGDESFLLYSDKGDKIKLLSVIKQYIVADRVEVRDVSSKYILIHINGLHQNLLPESIQVQRYRGFSGFIDILTANGDYSLNQLSAIPESKILFRRINAHIPSYPEEMNEEMFFSEARFRDAFAINKGCYVGQEVVEKIDTVGKTARVLKTVVFSNPIRLEDDIKDLDGNVLGSILTCSTDDSNNTLCFARLKNDKSSIDTKVLCGSVEGIIIW